jgi:hypothetical protein
VRLNLFSAQNPNGRTVPITVNLKQNDLADTVDGEPVWIAVFSAGVLDKDTGSQVEDVVIYDVTQETLLEQLTEGLNIMGDRINWGDLEDDNRPPKIKDITPTNKQTDVDYFTNVEVHLRDDFPTTGIDPSSVKLFVNELEVTPDLSVDINSNEALVRWVPKRY